MIKKQSKKIDAILSKIEERDNAEVVASKSKGKIKGRRIKSNFIK